MAGEYSKEQITAYYERISLPEETRTYEVAELEPKASLGYLKKLIKLHLASVPFENLVSRYPIIHICRRGYLSHAGRHYTTPPTEA